MAQRKRSFYSSGGSGLCLRAGFSQVVALHTECLGLALEPLHSEAELFVPGVRFPHEDDRPGASFSLMGAGPSRAKRCLLLVLHSQAKFPSSRFGPLCHHPLGPLTPPYTAIGVYLLSIPRCQTQTCSTNYLPRRPHDTFRLAGGWLRRSTAGIHFFVFEPPSPPTAASFYLHVVARIELVQFHRLKPGPCSTNLLESSASFVSSVSARPPWGLVPRVDPVFLDPDAQLQASCRARRVARMASRLPAARLPVFRRRSGSRCGQDSSRP